MAGKFIMTYKDFGVPKEVSTVVFNTPDVTAGNIVALTTQVDTVRLAMEQIMLGGIQQRQLVAWVNNTKIEPTDPFSQRESKWVVKYVDDSTLNPYHLEIPCADLNFLDPDNSGKADLDHATVGAFVTAFEGLHLSPEGNSVTVREILFRGRNI